MKKILSLIVILVLVTSIALAEVSRTDDSTLFAQGIDLLRQINDLRSLESAVDVFTSITSGFNSANYFKMYGQALINLQNSEYDDAIMRLELLGDDELFVGLLSQYTLPSCNSVLTYATARQAENAGKYSEAVELYSQTRILDSLDRIIELKKALSESTYQQAKALFETGDYAAALDLFSSLEGYRDSAEYARQASEMIPSSTEEPVQPQADERLEIYNSAKEKLENGELDGASELFLGLGDYSDSREQYEKIELQKEQETRAKNAPLVADTYSDHTYAVFENAEYTWEQAEAQCEILGGHLATIKSQDEQAHIETLISQGTKDMYWIGGKRSNSGYFYWVDDSSPVNNGYTHWDAGQPDNSDNDKEGRNEDYLQIYRIPNPDVAKNQDGTTPSKKFHWNDNVNENSYGESTFFTITNVGFICEWDTIVESHTVLGVFAKHTIKDGDYIIATFKDNKYYLDIEGSNIPAEGHDQIQLCYTSDGVINNYDAWTLRYNSEDGTYRISQRGQNMSLDVPESSKNAGVHLQVWQNNNAAAQKWEIYRNPDGSYQMRSKRSGLLVDYDGGILEIGRKVQQWGDTGSNAQKWTFIPYQP